MLPRNKITPILVLLFILFLVETVFAREQNFLFRFYQEHISVADGNRCAMAPSCSRYSLQAFEKHGPIMGWIMTCDRLIRCGRDDVTISPQIMVNHQPLSYDPVAANDFWWFDKEKIK